MGVSRVKAVAVVRLTTLLATAALVVADRLRRPDERPLHGRHFSCIDPTHCASRRNCAQADLRERFEHDEKAWGWSTTQCEDVPCYCTFGYGHVNHISPCDDTKHDGLRRGIAASRGTQTLLKDMGLARWAVMSDLHVHLTDGQYWALCDVAFSVDTSKFDSWTHLKVVNQNQMSQVPYRQRRWVMARESHSTQIALFFEGDLVPREGPPPGVDLTSIEAPIREGS